MSEPGDIPIKFRFFNDSEEPIDVESYAGTTPPQAQPSERVSVMHNVPPSHNVPLESQYQFPPIADPRHGLVKIWVMGQPLNVDFRSPTTQADMELLYARLQIDYAAELMTVEVWARDSNGQETPRTIWQG